jgi:hypothetical protein
MNEGVSFWANPHDKLFQLQARRIEVEVQQVITREGEHELWERIRLIGATDQDGHEVRHADLSMPVDVARALARMLVELADAIDRGDVAWEG